MGTSMSMSSSFPWTFGRSSENITPSKRWSDVRASPSSGSLHASLSPSPRQSFAKGYFAFPPGPSGSPTIKLLTPSSGTSQPSQESRPKFQEQQTDPEAHRRHEEARLRRLAQERALAEEGEIDWVRSGGILRDAKGRRDYPRTEQIRQELRLQEEEKRLTAQWDAYERRWQALISSRDPVKFEDIPWPISVPPTSVQNITSQNVEEFLLADMNVRGNRTTRKERIRTSMLRWHPDKMGSVVGRVIEEDEGSVQESVRVVFMSLKALQDDKKAS